MMTPALRKRQLASAGIALLLIGSVAAGQDALGLLPRSPRRSLSRRNAPLSFREQGGEAEEPANPFEDHIETDRDAFTPATSTAGSRRAILESSYSYIDNRDAADTNSAPELLARFGVSRRFELRLGWNYEAGGAGDVVSGSGGESAEGVDTAVLERETRMVYGFKAQVTEQRLWRPSSVWIVTGLTPTSGNATATQLRTGYAFGWELPNRWRLDSAISLSTDSDSGHRFHTWMPSTVLRIPLGERFQVHAEYFGQFSAGRESNFSRGFFSPGMHYLVTPNAELGVRIGWGLNRQTARFFSNVGFGLRF